MSRSKCIWLGGLLVVGLATWLASEGQAAPPNPFQPSDEFVVAQSGAPLMRGYDTLASVPRGQTLRVLKTEGPWVGTAVMVNGRKVGGWIWAGQAATPERYAAVERSTRRMYSLAPTPSYGGFNGYMAPNRGSNRFSMGSTPYGPDYWRADRKILGY